MQEYKLSFATIYDLGAQLYELIVDQTEEIDLTQVTECHSLMDNLTEGKDFFVLVNRQNSYSYSFQGQQEIMKIQNMKAVAVLVYDKLSETSGIYMKEFNSNPSTAINVFHDREIALAWLTKKISN